MSPLDPLSSGVPWTVDEQSPSQSPALSSSSFFQPTKSPEDAVSVHPRYARFTDTLRLYAGWLLAWYVLIFAFGSYQFTRGLPYRSDLLEQFFLSTALVSFAFGAYLFLVFTGLHRFQGRGFGYGVFLLCLGIGLVWVFSFTT